MKTPRNPLSKLNQHQAIVRALELRGERRVADARTTKYAVFTRGYAGLRDAEGRLIPIARMTANVFWYVGKSGALRIGQKTTGSLPVADKVKAALVAEGRTA